MSFNEAMRLLQCYQHCGFDILTATRLISRRMN